jgi:voltage-gated potassium channel
MEHPKVCRFFSSGLHYPYVVLFFSLILVIFFSPIFAYIGIGAYLLSAFLFLILFAGIYALSERRIFVLISIFIAACSAAGGILFLAYGMVEGFVLHYGSLIIFYGFMVFVIMSDLFRSREISNRTISGAVCVYLLVGFLFATAYFLIENFWPGSFAFAGSPFSEPLQAYPKLLYYSFITLTTTGTGDIYPMVDSVRALATIEAICGIFYIAIFITGMISILTVRDKKWEKKN